MADSENKQSNPEAKTSDTEPKLTPSFVNPQDAEEGDLYTIDSLLPKEFKAKVEEVQKEEVTQEAPKVKTNYSEDSDEVVAAANAKAKVSEVEAVEDEEEDIDLDLSSDNIDKLLNEGDTDAVKKKTLPGETESPFWHDDEDYKGFLDEYGYAQIDQAKLDNLIKATSEKAAIDNKKFTESLQNKISNAEAKAKNLAEENNRLKAIERAAYFDNLPETIEKYGKPMNSAVAEMRRILDTEGVSVNLVNLLTAKNKTEYTKLLENVELPDELNTQLVNHWRNYKELEFKHHQDKVAAKQDLSSKLNTRVSDDVSNQLLENSLVRLLQSDTKYNYIDEAINEGLNPDSPVSSIITKAKGNFVEVLNALANPTEYARNTDFLEGLSDYFFKAAHNEHIENNYHSVLSELEENKKNLEKVTKAFLKLRGSAKGIEGRGTTVSTLHERKDGSKKAEDKAKDFEAFLKSKLDIDEIMN